MGQTTSDEPKLLPFVGTFSVWYVCALMALTGIGFAIGMNFGRVGSLIVLILASMVTGQRFAKDMGREFVGTEKWKLAGFCLVSSYIWSTMNMVVATLLFVEGATMGDLLDAATNMPLQVWLFAVAFVSFFYYFAIVLFLGVGLKNGLKAK